MMRGPALDFNRPGLETQLPNYLQALEKRAADTPSLKALLDEDRFFLEQKVRVRHTLPERDVFGSPGHRSSANGTSRCGTTGAPSRRATRSCICRPRRSSSLGDLIVNPITFALSSYPTELAADARADRRARRDHDRHGSRRPAARQDAAADDDGGVSGAVAGRQGGEGTRPRSGPGESGDSPGAARS